MPTFVKTEISRAASDVLAERQRQVEVEGWSAAHDDGHSSGELALAAAAYAQFAAKTDRQRAAGSLNRANWWPWSPDWWKPSDRRRDLVKAGALILAEIERLDRNSAEASR